MSRHLMMMIIKKRGFNMLNEFLLDIVGALNSVMPENYAHAIFFRSSLAVGLLLLFVGCVCSCVVALVVACCKIGGKFIK